MYRRAAESGQRHCAKARDKGGIDQPGQRLGDERQEDRQREVNDRAIGATQKGMTLRFEFHFIHGWHFTGTRLLLYFGDGGLRLATSLQYVAIKWQL